VVLRRSPRTPRSNAGRTVGGLFGDNPFGLVIVSRRHPYTSNFGSGTSSGNRHSSMDVGPYELVSERHGDIVFWPCRCGLCRAAIGRVILLCLGRSDDRDSSGHFRVSLCKRHHRLADSSMRMRFHFCQQSIPKEPFERTLMLFEGRMYIVQAVLFVFLAQASNLFLSLEALGRELVRLL
jgi:hypothetical protein